MTRVKGPAPAMRCWPAPTALGGGPRGPPHAPTGPALFVDGWALAQLWAFWVAPLVGAVIAALSYRFVTGDSGVELIAEEGQDPTTAVTSAGEVPGQRTQGTQRAPN